MTDQRNPFMKGDRVQLAGPIAAHGTVAAVGTFTADVRWDDTASLGTCQYAHNLRFADATFKANGHLPDGAAEAIVAQLDDAVTRPAHYQRGGIETIDYIKATLGAGASDYMIGNVVKYVSRFKDKDGVRDLKKARQYLDWAIAEMEKTA